MKKRFLSFLILNFCLVTLFAVPGVESYVPTTSGEYVYYRDTSFTRESYVGILYYDESTYQIRYFAPADSENFLPPKEMAILMTVNPESNFWDMTGEKIISAIMPTTEDTDLINYLHDIMYDFSSKRKKADLSSESLTFTFNDDYAQFGGEVSLTFNNLIPVFNLSNISNLQEEQLFYCVTFGQLRNSNDKSFENFKGIPEDKSFHFDKKLNKKAMKEKKSKTTFDNHEFSLDKSWSQSMDNMWLRGNDAIITLTSIPVYSSDSQLNKLFITRKMIESTDGNYIDFTKTNITEDKNSKSFSIYTETYQPDEDQKIVSNKIFTLAPENTYDLFNLTMFQKSYEELQTYYLNIIKSYSHK